MTLKNSIKRKHISKLWKSNFRYHYIYNRNTLQKNVFSIKYNLNKEVDGDLQEGLHQGKPSQAAATSNHVSVVSPYWPMPPQEAFPQ